MCCRARFSSRWFQWHTARRHNRPRHTAILELRARTMTIINRGDRKKRALCSNMYKKKLKLQLTKKMREERNINNTEKQYIDDQCYGFQFRWLISNWVRERETRKMHPSTCCIRQRRKKVVSLELHHCGCKWSKSPPDQRTPTTFSWQFAIFLFINCLSDAAALLVSLDCNFFSSFSSRRVVSCHKNISHSNSKSEVTWEASSRFSTDDGGKAENYTLTISWLDDCCELPVFIFCCVRIAKEDINRVVGRKKESWAEVGRCTKPKTVVKNHVHFGTIGNHVAPTEFALFCNSTRAAADDNNEVNIIGGMRLASSSSSLHSWYGAHLSPTVELATRLVSKT